MNRLTVAIVAIFLLLVIGAGGTVFYLAYTGRQETIRREATLNTPSKFGESLKATSLYGAKLLIQKGAATAGQREPVNLMLKVTDDPSGKGITGLKAILTYDPKIFSLTAEAIQETLPSPWKYIRKEAGKDGRVEIEAVYLLPGVKGYVVTGPQKLATLNFTRQGKGDFLAKLDEQKSLVIFKENNISVPLKESESSEAAQ